MAAWVPELGRAGTKSKQFLGALGRGSVAPGETVCQLQLQSRLWKVTSGPKSAQSTKAISQVPWSSHFWAQYWMARPVVKHCDSSELWNVPIGTSQLLIVPSSSHSNGSCCILPTQWHPCPTRRDEAPKVRNEDDTKAWQKLSQM